MCHLLIQLPQIGAVCIAYYFISNKCRDAVATGQRELADHRFVERHFLCDDKRMLYQDYGIFFLNCSNNIVRSSFVISMPQQ